MEEKKKEKTGLAKRIFKWVLLVVLLIFLFFALIGLWAWKEQSDYESTAVPYLRSVVPEIATWNPDIAWNYFDDEVRDTISREDHAKIIHYLSVLGTLKSLGHPQFRQVTSSATIRTGVRKLVVYQIPAEFEHGDASINVTLLDRGGQFSIYSFNVNSMAFAEAQSQKAIGTSKQDETPE